METSTICVWKEGRHSTKLLLVDAWVKAYEKSRDLVDVLVSLKPGRRVGKNDRWVVLRHLGYGDTSNTWLCRDQLLQQVVAIKYTFVDYPHKRPKSDRYATATDVVKKISWRKEQPGLHEPGLQHLISLIESEAPCFRDAQFIPRAFEPLTISLERLVDILNDRGKALPIHFVRKCTRGLIEATRYLHDSMDLIHAGCSPQNVMFRLPNMQSFIRQDLWLVPTGGDGIDTVPLQPIGLSLCWDDDLRERFYEEAVVVMTGFTCSQWDHKKADTMEFDARMRPPEIWLKTRFEKSIDVWRIGATTAYMLLGLYLFDEESAEHALRAMAHTICGFSHKFVKDCPESRRFLNRKGRFRSKPLAPGLVGTGLIHLLRASHQEKDAQDAHNFLRKCLRLMASLRPTAATLPESEHWIASDDSSAKSS